MTSSEWTFCVCLLTRLLNASVSEVKTAQSGDDVLLLCRDHRGADIVLVKWIRPDLETELYVFFFRTHRTYKNYQHDFFHGRVKLRDPQSKDGDASVILKNVTINDTGTYDCYVGLKGNSPQLISSVHLKVKDSDQQITVKTGDDVTLQCLDHRGGDIELLEWRRLDLVASYIFFFRDDRTYENYQHPSFHGRVELKDPQMKDGDVSVILKNVTIKDTGTYECRVRNNNTQPPPQLITSVTLTVVNSGRGAGHTEDGRDNDGNVGLVMGMSVVTVLVVVGFMIYKRCRRPNKQNHQCPADEVPDHEPQVLNPNTELKMEEEEEPQWRHEYNKCNHKGTQASVFLCQSQVWINAEGCQEDHLM